MSMYLFIPPFIIYIYIYLLIYYLLAFTVTKKKKKNLLEFRDNKSRMGKNHCLGKKKKDHREKKKKKEKANFVTPVEKNQEICNQLVKRTKIHRKMLQCYNYKKCSILNRANYKN